MTKTEGDRLKPSRYWWKRAANGHFKYKVAVHFARYTCSVSHKLKSLISQSLVSNSIHLGNADMVTTTC